MSQLLDLDDQNLTPSEGSSRIREAGIHTNIKLVSVELVDKPADPAKNKQGYTACELVFENEQGEQHKELFMQPVSDPTRVNAEKTTKWYDNVAGRKEHTRSATVAEHIKIMNNEFAYFLMDLGGALGYAPMIVKQNLSQARNFKEMVQIFKAKHPPTAQSRINMRLLWQNNDEYTAPATGKTYPASSWLKIYFSKFPMYYPFGDDMFETYVPDRKPGIEVKDFHKKVAMVEKYPYVRQEGPSTNQPVVSYSEAAASRPSGMPATAAVALTEEDDPF
jgi:hypothetical protein